MRVCVEYTEECISSNRDGCDWYADYSSEVTAAYRVDDDDETHSYNSDVFLVADDATEVFVVYMIYNDGDSFGRATGKIDIIHCTSNEESADQLAKYIVDNKDEESFKFKDDLGRDVSVCNTGSGYFESIGYIGVERFLIGNKKSKRRYDVN